MNLCCIKDYLTENLPFSPWTLQNNIHYHCYLHGIAAINFQVLHLQGIYKNKCKVIFQYNLLILVPGICIFIMLPSIVFYLVEGNWTYIDSMYYAFVSLTTIGFGDFVNSLHGYEVEGKVSNWVWAYRGFTMLWLIFGLSFIYMIYSLVVDKIVTSKICPRIIISMRGSRRLPSKIFRNVMIKKHHKSITLTHRRRSSV